MGKADTGVCSPPVLMIPHSANLETRLKFQMERECRGPCLECTEFVRRQQIPLEEVDWKLVEMASSS